MCVQLISEEERKGRKEEKETKKGKRRNNIS
jgi:hypothetical protein